LPEARSVVAHVRKATAGRTSLENTHPFHVGDRIVAHNGTFGDLASLDSRLGADLLRLGVRGDTDSERLAALLVRETADAGGDEVEGYRRAVGYLSDHHPMTSLTSISVAPSGDLVALRYPENRSLFWKRQGLRDAADGHRLLAPPALSGSGAASGEHALTVLASRPLDDGAGWQELPPGKLLRIRADDLREELVDVIDTEPRLRFADSHGDPGLPWTGARRSTVVSADLGA
jgi:glutamine amidotransferase